MSLASIWLIGDTRECVFADAIGWLQSQFECIHFDSPEMACGRETRANSGMIPCAIVLLQARPGQFAAAQIEKLHAQEPLARLIELTGPWCEGERRSGRPIPGVTRASWLNWRERLSQELAIGGNTAPCPRTITETERIEMMRRSASSVIPDRGQARICTTRSGDFNYIADVVQRLGLSATLDPIDATTASPDVVIFCGCEEASLLEQQESVQSQQRRPRRILVRHFPRPEDCVLAQTNGIDAVLSHPLSIADLLAALAKREPCRA